MYPILHGGQGAAPALPLMPGNVGDAAILRTEVQPNWRSLQEVDGTVTAIDTEAEEASAETSGGNPEPPAQRYSRRSRGFRFAQFSQRCRLIPKHPDIGGDEAGQITQSVREKRRGVGIGSVPESPMKNVRSTMIYTHALNRGLSGGMDSKARDRKYRSCRS